MVNTVVPTTLERTYAGVLGKMAGVYLGRPVEGWSAERIVGTYGRIDAFLPGHPVVVADDDLSGAFTFVRALEGQPPGPATAEAVAATWLDQVVEGRTTLWWGGVGTSTEHTVFVRLRDGIVPPASGSAVRNGRRLAEQIGARIFADAWGLVHAHDPAAAAASARAAASVSHDGVAVEAAALMAAAVAAAFDGRGTAEAVRRGLAELPAASPLHDLDGEVGEALAVEGSWRGAFARVAARHPYARYGGHCPLVPNQAVVFLALRAAPRDLAAALAVAVGCGWDTDCNAGDVGSLMGVALGLDAFARGAARALREGMNDRLFVVAAEGGEVVTDALTVARRLRRLGDGATEAGNRFDGGLAGATHGAVAEGGRLRAPGAGLELGRGEGDAAGVARLSFPTFTTAEERARPGYAMPASPTLDPGQTVEATMSGGAGARARFYVASVVEAGDAVEATPGDASDGRARTEVATGPWFELAGRPRTHAWVAPATRAPIERVGLEVAPAVAAADEPFLRLHRFAWRGTPRLDLRGEALWAWRDAWFDAFDHRHAAPGGGIAFAHDRPGGWASLGGRAWADLRVDATWCASCAGEAALFVRGRGVRRRLALWLGTGGWRLVEEGRAPRPLAAGPRTWPADGALRPALEANGARARAWLGEALLADVALTDATAGSGAAGVACGPGTLEVRAFAVAPAADRRAGP
jgi:ADP-ribosylglycohydrolase